jgi:hypothetical protein
MKTPISGPLNNSVAFFGRWTGAQLLVYPVFGLHLVLTLQVLVLAHYFSFSALPALSYWGDDGHCGDGEVAVGVHCFGDYAFIRNQIAGTRPEVAGYWPGYPGLGNVMHWAAFSVEQVFSSYLAGLVFYMALLALAISIPWLAVLFSKAIPFPDRLLSVFSVGPMSLPGLIILDRGNSVGFLVPCLMLFAWAILRQEWTWATVGAVLAVSIKPQFLLLLLVLVVVRKVRYALLGLAATTLLNFLPYLIDFQDFPRNLNQSIFSTLAYGDYQILDSWYPTNIALIRIFPILFGPGLGPSWLLLIPFLALFCLIGFGFFLLAGRMDVRHVISVALVGSAFLVPTTYPYYLVVAVVICYMLFGVQPAESDGDSDRVAVMAQWSVKLVEVAFVSSIVFSLGALLFPVEVAHGIVLSTLPFVPVFWSGYLVSILVFQVHTLIFSRMATRRRTIDKQ